MCVRASYYKVNRAAVKALQEVGKHSSSVDSKPRALDWAESLTNVSRTRVPDTVYEALPAHFSERQIVVLTLIVATMNAWNRIAVGRRVQPPRR